MLINGAPGAGKSTVAWTVAQQSRLALHLDIDALKHALGQWERDPSDAGLQARRLALVLLAEHLRSGHDVIVSQYLARIDFIERLEATAAAEGAQFVECILEVDEHTLADRLARRADRPDRPEHDVNNRLVGPRDAGRLVASIAGVVARRPGALVIDASGTAAETAEVVRAALADGG